eukprot:2359277-Rhodomonas_salina.1
MARMLAEYCERMPRCGFSSTRMAVPNSDRGTEANTEIGVWRYQERIASLEKELKTATQKIQ